MFNNKCPGDSGGPGQIYLGHENPTPNIYGLLDYLPPDGTVFDQVFIDSSLKKVAYHTRVIPNGTPGAGGCATFVPANKIQGVVCQGPPAGGDYAPAELVGLSYNRAKLCNQGAFAAAPLSGYHRCRVRAIAFILLVLPACRWDWDRFDFSGQGADGAPTACRWDDPGKFTLEPPQPVSEVNSAARDFEPFLAADRLTLYFASERGDGLMRSYRATRAKPDGPFDKIEQQSGINVADTISRFATSADDLTAFIAAPSSYPADATGHADLFSATRASAAAPFTSAQFKPITSLNTVENEWDPFPSPDGLRLYYVEHIPSQSVNHLMVADRSGPGQPWVKRGEVPGLSVAPPYKADNPAVTADERLIVFSADLAGSVAGSRDLWYAVRSSRDQPFGAPQQLPVVNTEHFESEVYITPDGCQLYFVRSEGAVRTDEIYTTRYLPQ